MPRTLSLLGCLTLLCAPGCSRGGGGKGPSKGPPTLLSASLVESGAANNAPDAGEVIELFLDEDVALVAGALLTDADFVLSAGTLGNVTGAPSQTSSRRIRITLGAGVSFTPNVTTIAFAAMGQDAIRSTTSNSLAAGGNAVTFKIGDGTTPVATNLTLNAIPGVLNGTGAAAGVLLVPRNGFTIQFDATDAGSNLDGNAFRITADRSVLADGATVLPGVNLTPALTALAPSGSTWSYLVPGNVLFPVSPVTLTVVVFDTTGMGSTPITFPFQAVTADDGMRPFETSVNPRQTWFLDLSRDLESITSVAGTPIGIDYGAANGIPDLGEVLRVVGLQGVAPIPNVSGSRNSNDVAMDILRVEMLAQLALLFPGVNIQYTFTSPGGFPANLQPSYAAAAFSRMCVAGRSSVNGALGVALFDTRNAHQDDDCAHPGSTPSYTLRLGVFLDTLVAHPLAGINGPAGTLFRNTFDFFIRHRGTPIGDDAGDGTRLVNIENNTPGGDLRQTRMRIALVRMARFLAVVAAHETGHSMGLVKDGAQPAGFFGGDAAHFPGSSPGHIDLSQSGLLPGGAQEVMAPSISFDEALAAATTFNALELAYLRERSFCNGN